MKVNVKYKQEADYFGGLATYTFYRIIKYKSPYKVFRTTIKQELFDSMNMSWDDYCMVVRDALSHSEEMLKRIVARTISENNKNLSDPIDLIDEIKSFNVDLEI